MATNKTTHIPKLSDTSIVRAFRAVVVEHKARNPALTFQDIFGQTLDEAQLDALVASDGYSLHTAVLSVAGVNWQWTRTTTQEDPNNGARLDTLHVAVNKPPPDMGLVSKIHNQIHRELKNPLSRIGVPDGLRTE